MFQTGNDPEEVASLAERLKQLQSAQIVLETSGGYQNAAVAELSLAKLPVW